MTVKELCDNTGMNDKTVYRKIKRLINTELAGHVTRNKGDGYILDEYAVDILASDNIKLKAASYERDNLKKALERSVSFGKEQERKLCLALRQEKEKEQECDKLTKEIWTLSSDNRNLKVQIQNLRDDKDVLRRQSEEMTSLYNALLEDLKRGKSEYEEFMTQQLDITKYMKEKCDRAEVKMMEATARNDSLEKETAEKQREIDRLTAMLDAIPDKYKKKYIPQYMKE